jgi:hypothetical protein
MVSEKQLEANRANAQKSTGPRTDEGKKRSCLNATRHGLTGQVVVLPHEDMEAYNKFIQAIVATLEVADAHQQQLAVVYANLQWRINRAAGIEDTMFTLGIMEEVAENLNIENAEAHNATSNAKTFRCDAKAFDRLSIYNQRLINGAEKVLKQLKQLQADCLHRRNLEMAEATRLYKLHRMQSQAFDPKQNGFDLTVEQIKANISRQRLSLRAKIAEGCGWDLPKFEKETLQAAA